MKEKMKGELKIEYLIIIIVGGLTIATVMMVSQNMAQGVLSKFL